MSYQKRKEEVWNKARKISNADPDLYRQDRCGNVIYKYSYGKSTEMGWHIDHSRAQSRGGSDHLNNLQVMQNMQNISKGNKVHYDYNQGSNRKGLSVREFNKKK